MPQGSSGTRKNGAKPLPLRIVTLLRESWLLVIFAAAAYLVLILFSYDKTDPAWSHIGSVPQVHNLGGDVGAWLADVLLYVFGISAWWWVGLMAYAIFWGYRSIESNGLSDRRPFFIAATGFLVQLISSSGLEFLRLHSLTLPLPYAPGGMLGKVVGEGLMAALGFTGGSLLLLVLFAVGFSLFTGMSWIRFMERLGAWIEEGYLAAVRAVNAWSDRRAGHEATAKREEFLEVEKKRQEQHLPIRIEPPLKEVPKSERVQREKQQPLFEDLPDTALPPLDLLDQAPEDLEVLSGETLEFTSRLIERKLMDFGVEVKVVAAYPGPVITRYEIEPAVGVKGSQIVNLVRDLARALSVVSIRVVETIPGKSCMGLEIPNPHRHIVYLSEILCSQVYSDSGSPLTLAMGKDIGGNPVVADLAKMPHVLVAGTTGSGKSVALNAMIMSLVYKSTPAQVRMLLVDPKMLELSVYDGIPQLMVPVVTDMKQAANALNWCVKEMDRRYRLMNALAVRNLAGFNHRIAEAQKHGQPIQNPFSLTPETPEPLEALPLIVVVIDELADLMMVVGKKMEELVARLAQKARAAGVHLILATQRPSVDVITGLIKANIPARISFQVSSKVDSRTILDHMGAEALLGQGDMLYLPPGTGYSQRVHGVFVSDHEVHKVVAYLKSHGAPQYLDGVLEADEEAADAELGGADGGESDPLYDQAVAIVLQSRRASISLVQRHLRIGYNRAARLIEQMERAGLVSSMQSNGNREVLAPAQADR